MPYVFFSEWDHLESAGQAGLPAYEVAGSTRAWEASVGTLTSTADAINIAVGAVEAKLDAIEIKLDGLDALTLSLATQSSVNALAATADAITSAVGAVEGKLDDSHRSDTLSSQSRCNSIVPSHSDQCRFLKSIDRLDRRSRGCYRVKLDALDLGADRVCDWGELASIESIDRLRRGYITPSKASWT